MSPTLDQLRREWSTPCPTLSAVRQRYFPHIKTDRYMMHEINSGRIPVRYTRLHGSIRSAPVIYLHDLADYLDSCAPPANSTKEQEKRL